MGHTHSMRALREVRQAIQKHLTVHGARGGVAHATHASPPALMGRLLHLFEAPIASGYRRSIRCTCGRGRTAPRGRSCTGTPTCRVTPSGGPPWRQAIAVDGRAMVRRQGFEAKRWSSAWNMW